MEALASENAQLRSLLEAQPRLPMKTVTAEILYAGRDPFTRKIVIDKGSNAAVQPGQPVVDEAGVVGQVTRAYPFVAEVTLLTDKDQAVPVQNLRSGLRAIAFGGGPSGSLELRYMPVGADVQNGDVLVTSGIDGTYPPGIPVATVSRIERDSSAAFARIICTPIGGVNRHPMLLVLLERREVPDKPEPEPEPAPRKKRKGKGT
jgi:rod shape-determining protein MreC